MTDNALDRLPVVDLADVTGDAPPSDVDDWTPGENDRDEPPIAAPGRIAIANWYYHHADEVYHDAEELLDRAYDGEDVTPADAARLERHISALRHVLEQYIEPVAFADHGDDQE